MLQGVIAICSRGMIHSRTVKSVWNAVPRGWRPYWELITTDDLPIPEAQTKITEQALALDPKFIWYVEEDMKLPEGILTDMFTLCSPVVTADYHIVHWNAPKQKWDMLGNAVRHDNDGSIRFCGMGCLLVDADVFSRIEKPWFDTKEVTREGGVHNVHFRYGGQDVWFSRMIRRAGIEIAKVPAWCGHLRLEQPGNLISNKGVHKVVEL